MQKDQLAIGFAPNLVPLIKNGTKTFTYRLGDKYAFLQKGDKIAIRDSSTDEIFANIEITEKSETTFKELSINRVGHEVYESKEKQRETFQKYYKNVSDDDKVIILGFKIIK